MTNVGVRPTVEDAGRVNCETHILDFNESLYGKIVTTEFYIKLRDEKRFQNEKELIMQINIDKNAALSLYEKKRSI